MIYLYGHPRAGKTFLSRELSSSGLICEDLDQQVLQLAADFEPKLSLRDLFQQQFDRFCQLERQVMTSDGKTKNILSLGGSTLTRTQAPNGLIVYIHCPLDILIKRWQIDPPAALPDNDYQNFYQMRHAHYLSVCHCILAVPNPIAHKAIIHWNKRLSTGLLTTNQIDSI